MKQVWYVAYGSNLAAERFRCYVAGGRPTGGKRVYPGCRDKAEPARMMSVEVPGGLVFAGESLVWSGGMAFYDLNGPGRVAGRAYLLTAEQLGDVAAQEMRREPGGEFARDLAGLLGDVDVVHTMGPGRYETVARLGTRDGLPMFTVTHGDVSELEPAAPSATYVGWIATGLREAHGWSSTQIADYLLAAPGVSKTWTRDELTTLAGED